MEISIDEPTEAVRLLEAEWVLCPQQVPLSELSALDYCLEYAADPAVAQETVRGLARACVDQFRTTLDLSLQSGLEQKADRLLDDGRVLCRALQLLGTFDPDIHTEMLTSMLEAGESRLRFNMGSRPSGHMIELQACLLDAGDPTLLRRYVEGPMFADLPPGTFASKVLTRESDRFLAQLDGAESPSAQRIAETIAQDPDGASQEEDAQLLGRLRPADVCKIYTANKLRESCHNLLAAAGLAALRMPEAERTEGHNHLIALLHRESNRKPLITTGVVRRRLPDDPLDMAELRQTVLKHLRGRENRGISPETAATATDDPAELLELSRHPNIIARASSPSGTLVQKLASHRHVDEAYHMIDLRYPLDSGEAGIGRRLERLTEVYAASGNLSILKHTLETVKAYRPPSGISAAKSIVRLYVASLEHGHDAIAQRLEVSMRKQMALSSGSVHWYSAPTQLTIGLLKLGRYEQAAAEVLAIPDHAEVEFHMSHLLAAIVGLAQEGNRAAAAEVATNIDANGPFGWMAVHALRSIVSADRVVVEPAAHK